jgi:hypothetical protein
MWLQLRDGTFQLVQSVWLSVSTFSISVISCTVLVQVLHKNCLKFWLVWCVMICMNEPAAPIRQFTQKVEQRVSHCLCCQHCPLVCVY